MTCRSCGAPVIWVKTKAGKNTPLDAEPRSDGNLEIVDGVALPALPLVEGPRYTNHFSRCPQAKEWRKAR